MADSTQNPVNTNTANPTVEAQKKNSFFWGNEAVFDNLEKFERISNPTEEDQTFDFAFDEPVMEENQSDEGENLSSEEKEFNLEVVNLSQDTGEDSAPLEAMGLDQIFEAPQEEKKEKLTAEDLSNSSLTSEWIKNQEDEPASEQVTTESPFDLEPLPTEEEVKEEEEREEDQPLEPLMPDFDFNQNETLKAESSQEEGASEISFEENPEVNYEEVDETTEEEKISEEAFEVEEKNNQEELPVEEKTGEEKTFDTETIKENQENIQEETDLNTEVQAHFEMEKEPTKEFSPLMQKYQELLELSKGILKLQKKIQAEESTSFEIIGNSTEKSMITYLFTYHNTEETPSLELVKHEKDFARQEESEHLLEFSSLEKEKNLIIKVDKVQLYEEEKDLQDPIKAMQVTDKLNKFIFLTSEKQKNLQEERENLKAERDKIKAFREIFRNF